VEGNAVSGVPFRVACFVGLRVDRLGTIGDPDPEHPTWDRVNVEAVITKSPNCDNRDAYISTQQFVMAKKPHPEDRGSQRRKHLLAP